MIDHLLDLLLFAQVAPPLEIPETAIEVVEKAAAEITDEIAKVTSHTSRTNFGYLVAAVLFILGIKGMTHPRTAVRGNQFGALGMLIAVVVTLVAGGVNWYLVILGILAGSAGGVWLANTVQMTQMPQLVALFNGFGGIASVLVAGAEVLKRVGLSDVGPDIGGGAT